ncbi:hypothetical protein OEA41_007593 [Lepraria neglecta]|uniref:Uncharacterized protein n=1 Tax=Lepraria neglecta TaxID=209136 RepID=A0AAD9ZDV8_9LECA|nr:hypothetical protein OEA41_007593 [Lepraria neglecta]
MQQVRRKPSSISSRLDRSKPAASTPCISPRCPVKVPHNTGVYLRNGLPNTPSPAHPKFGFSNPPLNVWEAHRRITSGEGTDEDRMLLEGFGQFHGCREEAVRAMYLRERPASQLAPRDSLRHRVSYTPVETERAFTIEAGGDMFQNLAIGARPIRAIGTRPSERLAAIRGEQEGESREVRSGPVNADQGIGFEAPMFQNLAVRTQPIRGLGARPSLKLATAEGGQEEQDKVVDTETISPDTLKAFEEEVERAFEELGKEEREAGMEE